MQPKEFLMIPGPTPVPDQVLEAASRHPLGHRSQEFAGIHREAVEELKWLADTKNDMFILTASGTGAMDAAIANTINRGDKVLSLVSGVFGERFAKIGEAYGAEVDRLASEFGKPVSIDSLKERLKADGQRSIKAVTVTHNETSTGVINDLEQIARLVKDHGALVVVDAVTSMGGCAVPIDAWGLDIVVSGSQKALMLPPGLSFISVSKDAWQAYDSCQTPRFYFDFGRYRKSLEKDMTPFTPNVSLIVALKTSLGLIREEGKEAVYARHLMLRNALRAGIRAMGLELFVDDDAASPTITSILPPESVSVASIRSGLKERFRIIVADGQLDLKGLIFRIGHMGYVFERDILMTLGALACVLADHGYECDSEAALAKAGAALKS